MAESGAKDKWQEFRNSKLGLAFGLVLTVLLTLVLMLYGGHVFCFAPLLAAILLYLVPKYFGLKGMKKIAIFGILVLFAVGLIIGFTFFTILREVQPEPVSSNDGILTQGQVIPFRGNELSKFNYSVILTGGNDTPDLWLTTYDYFASNQARTFNLSNSFALGDSKRVFFVEVEVPKSLYRYSFSYRMPQSDEIVRTGVAWGPIMVSDGDILSHELYFNVIYVVVNGGLWFAFVLLTVWWMGSSKKRMEELQKRKMEQSKEETKEKFVCSECGADVPAEAQECPQCGEKFED
ncbi:MAG: hypothetical protein QW520_01825 [Methanomassiliicoccales archaeon]